MKWFRVTLLCLLAACQNTPVPELPLLPAELELSFEADRSVTNAVVNLRAEVNGVPDELELYLNDSWFRSLDVAQALHGIELDWDTRRVPEGEHQFELVATLAEKHFQRSLRIQVDRSPPRVLELSPATDTVLTAFGETIVLLFSEAIDETSLRGANVTVTNQQGAELASRLSYEANRLTIQLSESVKASTALMLELDVKDLAGNPLVASWSWSVRQSQPATRYHLLEPSSSLTSFKASELPVQLVADQTGRLAVVWLDGEQLHVKLREGTNWQYLPDPFTFGAVYRPDIALSPEGQPIVSWQQTTATGSDITVQRWNGMAWEDLGVVNVSTVDAAAPALTVDEQGIIYLGFLEHDGTSQNVQVKRWTGSSWEALGGVLDVSREQNASQPAMALDTKGQPFVVWREDRAEDLAWHVYVKYWNGEDWQQIGSGLNVNPYERADMPSIALDSSQPVVAWSEYDMTSRSNNIYVKRWNGTSWEALGEAVEATVEQRSVYPSVAVSQNQLVTVSWWAFTAEKHEIVEVAHWQDNSWQYHGVLNSKTTQAFYPVMGLRGAEETPVFAWLECTETTEAIVVKQADDSTD